jgi:hypothetical protein
MAFEPTLEIGGIRIRFRSARPDAKVRFNPPYAAFLSQDKPDLNLDVYTHPPPPCPDGRLFFDTGETWCMVETRDSFIIYGCLYEDIDKQEDEAIVIRKGSNTGSLFIPTPKVQGGLLEDPLRFPLDQILLIHLMGQGRGLLVHACGVLDGEQGYCFAGASGQGKSTMARLWDGKATILSDDRLIIRPKDGGFLTYGTPWSGTYPATSPMGFPVSDIFLLVHGPRNNLTKLTPAEAAKHLLIASFPPYWDRDGMEWTLKLLEAIVSRVAVWKLAFRPDEEVVDFIRQATPR